MSFIEGLAREYACLSAIGRTFYRMRHVKPDARYTISDVIEEYARTKPSNAAILCKEQIVTYRDLSEGTNRYARWAIRQGVRKGDTVALLMANRPEYVMAWLGIAKLGGVVALLNPTLRGDALAHCVAAASVRHVIAGSELAASYASVWPHMETHPILWTTGSQTAGAEDLDAALAECSPAPIDKGVRGDLTASDAAVLIYAPGTTEWPTAISVSHERMLTMMFTVAGALGASASDRMYNTLPLCRSSGGIYAVGAALTSGGSLIVREKFAAEEFWRDCHRFQPTLFQYSGDLCAHLLHTPDSHYERYHSIRAICGTGLRAEFWPVFQRRFNIPRIVEFYSAAEGQIAMINYDGKVGAVGRIPHYMRNVFGTRLVKFDVDADMPLRDAKGFCMECEPNQEGELIVKSQNGLRIAGPATDTSMKILRDVFELGDAWRRTGDRMCCDENGYFFFVERIADTFCWKGEVVSSRAVENELLAVPGILKATVYGVSVPSRDGRAAMAALVVDRHFDVSSLAATLSKTLAPSARPYFLRLRPGIVVSRKRRKDDLVKDGFVPDRISDPLYWLNSDAVQYERLDPSRYADIVQGRARL